MNQKKRLSVKTVVLIGMFGALAAVLETFQIPVPFAPPFYKLDFAETPIMIGAFALGPVPAILMELVKNLLKILINGTTTMYVGDLGNFIGGLCFQPPFCTRSTAPGRWPWQAWDFPFLLAFLRPLW